MSERYERALDRLSRVRGVRGSMYVAAEDGLPVAQMLMGALDGGVLAAFAASLARKATGAADVMGAGAVRFLQMQASGGVLLVAVGDSGLLVTVVADSAVNVGLARLEMMKAVEAAEE